MRVVQKAEASEEFKEDLLMLRLLKLTVLLHYLDKELKLLKMHLDKLKQIKSDKLREQKLLTM